MQNESDRFAARRLLGNLCRSSLLAALVSSAPHTLAAPADAPAATTDESAATSAAEPTKRSAVADSTAASAAKPASQPTKKPDATSSKEPGEFKPSESLSEDATVAYPSDI